MSKNLKLNVSTQLTENFRLADRIRPVKNMFRAIPKSTNGPLAFFYLDDRNTIHYVYREMNSNTGWAEDLLPQDHNLSESVITDILGYDSQNIRGCTFLQLGHTETVYLMKDSANWAGPASDQNIGLPMYGNGTVMPTRVSRLGNSSFEEGSLLFAVSGQQNGYIYAGMNMDLGYTGGGAAIHFPHTLKDRISLCGFKDLLHACLPADKHSHLLSFEPALVNGNDSLPPGAVLPSAYKLQKIQQNDIRDAVVYNSAAGTQVLLTLCNDTFYSSVFDETTKTWGTPAALDSRLPPDVKSARHLRAGEFTDPTDGKSYLHIFIIDQHHDLIHFRGPVAGNTSGFTEGIMIAHAPSGFELAADVTGQLNLFLPDVNGNMLCMWQDVDTYHWDADYIAVHPPAGTKMRTESLRTYTCSIEVTGQNGMAIPGIAVEVSAAESVQVQVNGQGKRIPTKHPLTIYTNVTGKIDLVYETTAIYVPSFWVKISDNNPYNMTGSGPGVLLQPVDLVLDKMNKNSTKALVNELKEKKYVNTRGIKDPYIVPAKYRNDKTLVPVVEHAKKIAKLMTEGTSRTTAFTDGATPHMNTLLTTKIDISKISPCAFQLEVKSTGHVFTELPAKGQDKSKIPVPTAEAADILNGINSGTIALRKMTVHVNTGPALALPADAGRGILCQVQTTDPGGGEVSHTIVIRNMDETTSLMQSAFASADTFAHQIWEWLGFIFNWDDIVLTHNAIYNTSYIGLNLLGNGLTSIRDTVITRLEQMKQTVSGDIDAMRAKITQAMGVRGNSVGGIMNNNQGDQTAANQPGVKNSPITNILINHLPASSNSLPAAFSSTSSQAISIISQMQNWFSANYPLSNMEAIFSRIKQLFATPDGIAGMTIDIIFDILKDVVGIAFNFIEFLVKLIMDIARSTLLELIKILTDRWDIWLLSSLYEHHIVDSESNGKPYILADGRPATLCGLGLLALVAAVPATIIYKIACGKAPFISNYEVTDYTNYIKSLTIPRSDLRLRSMVDQPAVSLEDTKPWASTMNIVLCSFGLVLGIVGGVCSAYLDVQSVVVGNITYGAGAKVGPSSDFMSRLKISDSKGFVINIVSLTCQCLLSVIDWLGWVPYGPAANTAVRNSLGTVYAVTNVGFFIFDKRQVAYAGPVGMVVECLFGAGFIIFDSIMFDRTMKEIDADPDLTPQQKAVQNNLNNMGFSACFIGDVPSFLQPIRAEKIVQMTSGVSLVVIAVADVACSAAAGSLYLAAAIYDHTHPS